MKTKLFVGEKEQFLNGNFLLFLFGRMVSDTGTSIQIMIMPLYIIDAGGSASTVGIFTFLSLVPVLIVYPLAGVLGDRKNRKTIMVVTDLASAGVILGLALISYLNLMSLTLLMLVQVIIALLNGLFDPATRGMLPQIVDSEQLTKANSAVASVKTLSFLLGPVIGAVLYVNFSVTILFLINGISFLLSGTSEMMIRYTHNKHKTAADMRGILSDLSEGIKFILAKKNIRKLCYFFLVIYFLYCNSECTTAPCGREVKQQQAFLHGMLVMV